MPRLAWMLAVLALAGCGDEDEPAREAAAPKPSITPFPTVFGGVLKPDVEYTTQLFEPNLRVKVPDEGWIAYSQDSPDHVELEGEAEPPVQDSGIGFHHMTKVFDPEKGGETPGDAVDGPEDFAAWLTSHP